MIDLSTGNLRQFTYDVWVDHSPRWSPNGERIAFFSNRSGKSEIWTIHNDGSNPKQLTRTIGYPAWPVWSPDAKQLVYTIFGGNPSIIEVAEEGISPTLQNLPPPEYRDQTFNAWSWSPNSQRLAGFFQRKDGMFTGVGFYTFASRIYTKLTSSGTDPIWLGDDKRLLYLDKGSLFLVDSETGKNHKVLSIAPHEIALRGFTASRDSRRIYYSMPVTEADIWLANWK